MRPSFLKAEVDQRRAFREVGVSAGDLARADEIGSVGHDDEVPLLLIAGRWGLSPVDNNLSERLRIDFRSVEGAARASRGNQLQQLTGIDLPSRTVEFLQRQAPRFLTVLPCSGAQGVDMQVQTVHSSSSP